MILPRWVPKNISPRMRPKHIASQPVNRAQAPVAILTTGAILIAGIAAGPGHEQAAIFVPFAHRPRQMRASGSPQLRHIGLMARVIAASSSCEVSLVIEA